MRTSNGTFFFVFAWVAINRFYAHNLALGAIACVRQLHPIARNLGQYSRGAGRKRTGNLVRVSGKLTAVNREILLSSLPAPLHRGQLKPYGVAEAGIILCLASRLPVA